MSKNSFERLKHNDFLHTIISSHSNWNTLFNKV